MNNLGRLTRCKFFEQDKRNHYSFHISQPLMWRRSSSFGSVVCTGSQTLAKMNYYRLCCNFGGFCAFILTLCLAFTAAASLAQTPPAAVSIPANLTVEGAPPIDKTIAEKVARYNASRSAQLLSWQPRKREMLVATRFGETVQVHRVTNPGGARRQLTFFPDRVSAAWFEPKNGDYFVFLKDQAGDENFHLYRQDLSSGDYIQLTKPTGFDSVDSVKWSPDGATLFYISVKLKTGEAAVCRTNPLQAEENECFANLKGVLWQISDVSANGSKILLYEYVATGKSAIYSLDAKTGSLERLTPDVAAVFSDAAFAADGKTVLLSSNQNGEFSNLVALDLATKEMRAVLPAKSAELETFAQSPNGKQIAVVYNENGNSRFSIANTLSRKETLAPQLPVGVITNLQWFGPDEIGFNLETARFPADVYSYDLRNKRLTRWTTSETGGVNTTNLREAELIEWQAADGKMISGVMYRPAQTSAGKLPVLIDVHGGPQTQSRPTFPGRYNYIIKEMGIAVIYPNVRGSSGFGKSFMDADNGERRGEAVRDLRALLDWIAKQPDLDANRVAVRGESYGALLALSLGLVESSRLKAAIATSPVVSISQYISKSPESLQTYLRAEYGDERDAAQAEFMNRLSPFGAEENWRLPLLLAVGKRDARIPVATVEQLQGNFRKRQIPVVYLSAGRSHA